jgi:hypothetical protein
MGVDYSGVVSATEQVTGLGVYEIELRLAGLGDLQDWLQDPGVNFGWVMVSEAEELPKTARRFATRESGAGAPKLLVDYAVEEVGLRVEGVRLEVGEFRCEFLGEAGLGYVWERGVDVGSGVWEEVERVPVQSVAGWVQFTNAMSAVGSHFYRVRVLE